jgi:hypothetical protein
LVVRGEPGIAKSALLAVTAERAAASGMRVLTTSSFQSEADLAFAGLHQLLRSVLGQVKRLLDAGRDAGAAPAAERGDLTLVIDFGVADEMGCPLEEPATAAFEVVGGPGRHIVAVGLLTTFPYRTTAGSDGWQWRTSSVSGPAMRPDCLTSGRGCSS